MPPSDNKKMNEECNQLLCKCALKDYKAFQQLYNLASPKLFAVSKRILNNNNELAEEALQEAMIKIWHKSDVYRPDLSNAMTWMTRIVRNQSLDLLRSQIRLNTHFDIYAEVDALNQLISVDVNLEHDSSLTISLQACMETIQKQHKQCISMIYLMGCTYKEVAEVLGRPIGTVKGWVHRGMEDLKKCLQ